MIYHKDDVCTIYHADCRDIEIEERYCEIAARRLQQQYLF